MERRCRNKCWTVGATGRRSNISRRSHIFWQSDGPTLLGFMWDRAFHRCDGPTSRLSRRRRSHICVLSRPPRAANVGPSGWRPPGGPEMLDRRCGTECWTVEAANDGPTSWFPCDGPTFLWSQCRSHLFSRKAGGPTFFRRGRSHIPRSHAQEQRGVGPPVLPDRRMLDRRWYPAAERWTVGVPRMLGRRSHISVAAAGTVPHFSELAPPTAATVPHSNNVGPASCCQRRSRIFPVF